LANPDLQLRSRQAAPELTGEQQERRQVVFEMLVSLFERAYLLAYDEDMTEKQRRRWHSWDDYMREWCRRADFCAMLPQLLEGEDSDTRRFRDMSTSRINDQLTNNPALVVDQEVSTGPTLPSTACHRWLMIALQLRKCVSGGLESNCSAYWVALTEQYLQWR
jgi:hypothetical protein